jgi:putative endopeptidase
MRLEPVAQHRRAQGEFQRNLGGRQPPQAHGRVQRFGGRQRLLTVRNAAEALTAGLLLAAAVSVGPPRGPRSAPAEGSAVPRPALLPGAAAAGNDGYAMVNMAEPFREPANAAAAGCLLQPRSCSQLLTTAMLSGIGGVFVGLWAGWEAAERHQSCRSGTPSLEPPRPAGLTAARNDTDNGVPPTVRFQVEDLDPTANPCHSLDAYVNGRWANRTRVEGPFGRWHVTGVLQEQSMARQRQLAERLAEEDAPTPAQRVVADLWTSGMDAFHINGEQLRPLRDELAAIEALNDTASIAGYLRMLTAEGRNPLFGFAVEADMDNRTTLMAYAHQGGLGLPDPGDYLDVRRNDIRQDYWAYIMRLLMLSGVSETQARADAASVYSLEQRLATVSMNRDALASDVRLYYNPVTPAQADALTPNFSWTRLFQALGIATPPHFSLGMPGFHQEVSAALGDTDPSVWRAYLRFHCLDQASPYLGDAFVTAAHDYQQGRVHLNQPVPPRWKRVLAAIDAFAGRAMSEVYADTHFPQSSRTRVEQMAGQIRTVLRHRLGTLPWMDEATRLTAQAKADQIEPHIGHPEHFPDWSGLRTERCGFLANLRRARAHQTRERLSLIGEPANRQPARFNAHSVAAYFDVLNNEMAFSAALLQPPYFDPDADDALNYGAAGWAIGHEMAHAFTAETSQFALDRQIRQWWSEADLNRYAHLVQGLAAQFDQEQIDGLSLNGTRTANENMADLGGLILAFDALQAQTAGQPDPMIDGLSREQRFFISGALINRRLQTRQRLQLELQTDPHALGAPRTNGAPSNMPAFAEAFHCPPGTRMARSEHNRVAFL